MQTKSKVCFTQYPKENNHSSHLTALRRKVWRSDGTSKWFENQHLTLGSHFSCWNLSYGGLTTVAKPAISVFVCKQTFRCSTTNCTFLHLVPMTSQNTRFVQIWKGSMFLSLHAEQFIISPRMWWYISYTTLWYVFRSGFPIIHQYIYTGWITSDRGSVISKESKLFKIECL